MLYLLLTTYLSGFAALMWGFWLLNEINYYRVLELLIWPITLLVGSIRKLINYYWRTGLPL